MLPIVIARDFTTLDTFVKPDGTALMAPHDITFSLLPSPFSLLLSP
jgi:hypothetical protein